MTLSATRVRKLKRKGCDWIIANDVTPPSNKSQNGVMGGDRNSIILITDKGEEAWDEMSKTDVARALADRIADALRGPTLVKAADLTPTKSSGVDVVKVTRRTH